MMLDRWQLEVMFKFATDAEMAGRTVAWLLLWAVHWDHQLEEHAYPGQPTHHSAPPTQPCRCWYGCLSCGITLPDLYCCAPPNAPSYHPATGFIINPRCPHHGHQ